MEYPKLILHSQLNYRVEPVTPFNPLFKNWQVRFATVSRKIPVFLINDCNYVDILIFLLYSYNVVPENHHVRASQLCDLM